MNIVIEKNIPAPELHHRATSGLGHSLRTMGVGDSFAFPLSVSRSVAARMVQVQPATGFKFARRKIDEENGRVWRIA